MLEFNWKDLNTYTKSNPDKILEYLNKVFIESGSMYDFLNQNEWARKIYNSPKTRDSYILNLEGLINNEYRAISSEQYTYLDLLSKRNKFTYFNTRGKVTFLPCWQVEDTYNINMLKTNRLLNIENNNIFFIHEEEI